MCTSPVAIAFAETGEDLLGALGVAEARQGVYQPCPRRGGDQLRRGEMPG
jgi:hypothetical protein